MKGICELTRASKAGLELLHSWGFALREGVFVETKEGICRNKDLKKASASKVKAIKIACFV